MGLKNAFAVLLLLIFHVSILGGASANSAKVFGSAHQDVLRVPFAPPINQPIDYEVTLRRIGTPTAILHQTLRFDRAANGFILTVSLSRLQNDKVSLDLTRIADRNRVPLELRPLLLPLSFDLSPDGTIMRLRDWPHVQQAIAEMPSALVANESPAKRAETLELMRRALAPYRSMTAEQAPDAILKGWPSLLGLGGMELIAGKEYAGETVIQPPMLPIAIPARQNYSLSRSPNGDLKFSMVTQPQESRMGQAIADYLDHLGASANASQRANLQRASERFRGMQSKDSIDAELDQTTGLVTRARIERWISIPEMGEGKDVIEVLRRN